MLQHVHRTIRFRRTSRSASCVPRVPTEITSPQINCAVGESLAVLNRSGETVDALLVFAGDDGPEGDVCRRMLGFDHVSVGLEGCGKGIPEKGHTASRPSPARQGNPGRHSAREMVCLTKCIVALGALGTAVFPPTPRKTAPICARRCEVSSSPCRRVSQPCETAHGVASDFARGIECPSMIRSARANRPGSTASHCGFMSKGSMPWNDPLVALRTLHENSAQCRNLPARAPQPAVPC